MILAPESVSTVADRVTILRIKLVHRPGHQAIQRELDALQLLLQQQFPPHHHRVVDFHKLLQQLQDSNQFQWELEDKIRYQTAMARGMTMPMLPAEDQLCNLRELADLIHSLHISNRKRCDIKAAIDQLCGDAPEVKVYVHEKDGPAGPHASPDREAGGGC